MLKGTYLKHQGIKGQKWGVRRFQFANGTLTEAGKRRYLGGIKSDTNNKKEKKEQVTEPKEAKMESYKEDDPDFSDYAWDNAKQMGDTDFRVFTRDDGTKVVLEEDMKWVLPQNTDISDLQKRIVDYNNLLDEKRNSGEKWSYEDWEGWTNKIINGADPNTLFEKKSDKKEAPKETINVEAVAKDVIRGKYGNGEDRKKALGENYTEVQKLVNQLLKKKK